MTPTLPSSQRRRRQFHRACKKQKKDATVPLKLLKCRGLCPRRLPSDIIARVLTYIDVRDVPSVATICKEWRKSLKLIEEELWLSLVRKHHPDVEEMTAMLGQGQARVSTSVFDKSQERGNEPPVRKRLLSLSTSQSSIPPPSLDWKTQFQRRHMLIQRAESADRARSHPLPRPISSYVAQVDLICKNASGEKLGLISVIVEDLSFEGEGDVELSLGDLGPRLSSIHDFARFDLRIHFVEKSTGRATLFFVGSAEDWLGENSMGYGCFGSLDVVPVLGINSELGLMSSAILERTGCECECEGCDHGNFFVPVPARELCNCGECGTGTCNCCDCKERWRCFHRYSLSLSLFTVFDFEDLGQDEWLRILQDGLVYS